MYSMVVHIRIKKGKKDDMNNKVIDTTFERLMLRDAVTEARKLGAKIKSAWVHATCNMWEFHYKGFYWWGKAENAYHARALGWEAWCEKQTHKDAA